MSGRDCEQLTLFPADSPASHSAQPGSAEAKRMTVTSGRKCLELSKNCGPLGSLEKTLLASQLWHSTRCWLIWKPKVTKQGRLWYQLQVSAPSTDGTDLQSWPTPSASDGGRTAINPILTKNGTIRHKNKAGGQSFARLDQVVALFPTPKARDYKDTTAMPPSRERDSSKDSLPQRIGRESKCKPGGTLNPDWVEWLMGFPPGWTEVSGLQSRIYHGLQKSDRTRQKG